MKIITKQGTLQSELFQSVMLHDALGIITFSYVYTYAEDKGEGAEYQVQIPVTFYNRFDARVAFRRYLRARNTNQDSVSFMGFQCNWPWETYIKIIRHKSLELEKL